MRLITNSNKYYVETNTFPISHIIHDFTPLWIKSICTSSTCFLTSSLLLNSQRRVALEADLTKLRRIAIGFAWQHLTAIGSSWTGLDLVPFWWQQPTNQRKGSLTDFQFVFFFQGEKTELRTDPSSVHYIMYSYTTMLHIVACSFQFPTPRICLAIQHVAGTCKYAVPEVSNFLVIYWVKRMWMAIYQLTINVPKSGVKHIYIVVKLSIWVFVETIFTVNLHFSSLMHFGTLHVFLATWEKPLRLLHICWVWPPPNNSGKWRFIGIPY